MNADAGALAAHRAMAVSITARLEWTGNGQAAVEANDVLIVGELGEGTVLIGHNLSTLSDP
jgi:hypothetical protein